MAFFKILFDTVCNGCLHFSSSFQKDAQEIDLYSTTLQGANCIDSYYFWWPSLSTLFSFPRHTVAI